MPFEATEELWECFLLTRTWKLDFFRGASGECGLKCAVFIIKDRKDCKDCKNLIFGAKEAYILRPATMGRYRQIVRLIDKVSQTRFPRRLLLAT